MGRNCVIVGFHVGWTLTAIGLSVPASRVVDLGTEPTFQHWCTNLALRPNSDAAHLAKLFHQPQKTSYDRRWPTLLVRKPVIKPYATNSDDIFAECIYTAGYWRAVCPNILLRRIQKDVFALKSSYVVGCGPAPDDDECTLLETVRVHTRRHWVEKGKNATKESSGINLAESESFFDLLTDTAEAVRLGAKYDTGLQPVAKWSSTLTLYQSLEKDDRTFEPVAWNEERVATAVNMQAPSIRLADDPDQMIPWINHHTETPYAVLRELDKARVAKFDISENARRLIASFIDLAFDEERMQWARTGGTKDVTAGVPGAEARAEQGPPATQASTAAAASASTSASASAPAPSQPECKSPRSAALEPEQLPLQNA